MKLPITVCIPTLNEEQNIKRCIESVLWADEIIVLDCGSIDKTVEIARNLGANIFTRKWDNTANKFSYLFSLAKNKWVLHLDADEVCSPQLQQEVVQLFEKGDKMNEYDAYLVNRKNFFFTKWIKKCGLYPEYGPQLFKKDKIRLECKGFHHRVFIEGKVGILPEEAVILHYGTENFERFMEKSKREVILMAQWRFEQGEKFSVLKLLGKSLWNFLKKYLLQLGFLEGKHGLILAILSSFYITLQYIKLWELGEKENCKNKLNNSYNDI